ncbi:MAG: hypothetical protein ACD_51C00047G0002 [uncultured bacterium]|nr:MAG: hypothetical protein ACD_51C00047G0002 [uncultured bacterium]
MEQFMQMIEEQLNFQDLSGTFTVTDVVIAFILSFLLTSAIAYVYKITHKGMSYTQSFVHTLVFMGMITSLIMMIVGSNIARAFSLVGALSIIRFRNAVKETRDVGFIFFAMAIGMATGTKFYLLAMIATAIISLSILMMNRFNWFAQTTNSLILKVQLQNNMDFDVLFNDAFVKYTDASDLISIDSVRSGMLTELVYSIVPKKKVNTRKFLSDLKNLNGNNKVTLITGYNNTDL